MKTSLFPITIVVLQVLAVGNAAPACTEKPITNQECLLGRLMQVINQLLVMNGDFQVTDGTVLQELTTTATTTECVTTEQILPVTEIVEEAPRTCGAGRLMYPVLKMECVDFADMKKFFDRLFGEKDVEKVKGV